MDCPYAHWSMACNIWIDTPRQLMRNLRKKIDISIQRIKRHSQLGSEWMATPNSMHSFRRRKHGCSYTLTVDCTGNLFHPGKVCHWPKLLNATLKQCYHCVLLFSAVVSQRSIPWRLVVAASKSRSTPDSNQTMALLSSLKEPHTYSMETTKPPL